MFSSEAALESEATRGGSRKGTGCLSSQLRSASSRGQPPGKEDTRANGRKKNRDLQGRQCPRGQKEPPCPSCRVKRGQSSGAAGHAHFLLWGRRSDAAASQPAAHGVTGPCNLLPWGQPPWAAPSHSGTGLSWDRAAPLGHCSLPKPTTDPKCGQGSAAFRRDHTGAKPLDAQTLLPLRPRTVGHHPKSSPDRSGAHDLGTRAVSQGQDSQPR